MSAMLGTSILCQEQPYLRELVRYIHLNPSRAKIVKSIKGLDNYPFCAHNALIGKYHRDFQDTDDVLWLFGKNVSAARKMYRAYLQKGISKGRRPELAGGGLIRSAGGWAVVNAMRRAQDRMKGDERILGDGEFMQSVLDGASERLTERFRLQARGYDLDKATQRVSSELKTDPDQVWTSGKHPITA